MCGIVGVLNQIAPREARPLLARLLNTMRARGPDGTGQFFDDRIIMGMTRLAVIDVAGGGQPLFSRDRHVVVFQNGEIYNHVGLRRELERCGALFSTDSDTEVLAHGYEQWGIDRLLEKIDGMYAIAILDRRTQELHLARDRFGEKPLYYSVGSHQFAYSSNTRALGLLPWVDIGIEGRSVDRYLALHYVPGRQTLFRGIQRVLPGERLTVCVQSLKLSRQRYYVPSTSPIEAIDNRALLELIESAVTTRLVSDVPVGVFLSGGVDSSIVAAFAAQHHPAIDTFSMGFKDVRYDESHHAEAVARAIGSSHHHFTFDETAFVDLLPAVVDSLDEPIGDQALLPTYWLCREAKQYVKVVLSGEGADELFAGYDYYRTMLPHRPWWNWLQDVVAGRDTRSSPDTLCENARPVTPSGFPLVMDVAGRRGLLRPLPFESDAWEEQVCAFLERGENALQRATVADILTWLPDDLLVKLDRMAMANSLEGRAPFLTPKLVEAAIRLPCDRRMTQRHHKVALREVAAFLLPRAIVERKKQGFVLPMARWLQQWLHQVGNLQGYFDLWRIPNFDVDAAVSLVKHETASAHPNERLLFSLIILAEWHHSFFKRLAVDARP